MNWKITKHVWGEVYYQGTVTAPNRADALRLAYQTWQCNPVGCHDWHFEAEPA